MSLMLGKFMSVNMELCRYVVFIYSVYVLYHHNSSYNSIIFEITSRLVCSYILQLAKLSVLHLRYEAVQPLIILCMQYSF